MVLFDALYAVPYNLFLTIEHQNAPPFTMEDVERLAGSQSPIQPSIERLLRNSVGD